MVVDSSPDDVSFSFCLFFFLLPRAASLAEVIQNSHIFSQENGFLHPKSAWSLTFWLEYTMCCIDAIEAVQGLKFGTQFKTGS